MQRDFDWLMTKGLMCFPPCFKAYYSTLKKFSWEESFFRKKSFNGVCTNAPSYLFKPG